MVLQGLMQDTMTKTALPLSDEVEVAPLPRVNLMVLREKYIREDKIFSDEKSHNVWLVFPSLFPRDENGGRRCVFPPPWRIKELGVLSLGEGKLLDSKREEGKSCLTLFIVAGTSKKDKERLVSAIGRESGWAR